MTYVYTLDHHHGLPPAELASLIGGKAAGLTVMAAELALPVPPGFAITTAACREYLSAGWPSGLDQEIATAMRRLEGAVGRRFGDAGNPLLVSVRSGAPVSMPGMMDTILDLGLNERTTRGLADASGDAAFAADCRRRFVEMYTRVVGVATAPDDPWDQLRAAVEAVFRSWNSDRASAYRIREGIAGDLGTAVTVQAMVFGNWGAGSASGVLFTRNPATGEASLYGDVLFASQGEDVVAGAHRTEPVSVVDERLPQAGAELRRCAEVLERHFADLCDIEFTIEQGRLWLLQVRPGKRSPRAALRIAVEMAEAPGFPLSRAQAVERTAALLSHPPTVSIARRSGVTALASGLPASPGVATGEVVTSASAAVTAADEGRSVILVRAETSPDDVRGMARAAGVLTSRGGLASHAAVVARGWGIPAVVGAEAVEVRERDVNVAGHVLKDGDVITIDGSTGEVFAGTVDGSTAPAPEAAILVGWARELGIEIPGDPGELPVQPGVVGHQAGEPGNDDVVRALLIKGSATTESLASALVSSGDRVREMVDRLVADGRVEVHDEAFRLTREGRGFAEARVAADRQAWGARNAESALEGFQPLDRRVKDAVTAWQLREVGGAQAANDHTDAAYDASVLERLAGLHHDATTWLLAMSNAPRELDLYRARLQRAMELARAGDHRFVASPRVDSYHSVWFELHEDLILLAGRSRAEESAAGRA